MSFAIDVTVRPRYGSMWAASPSPRTSSRTGAERSSRSRTTSRTSPAATGSDVLHLPRRSTSRRRDWADDHPLLHPIPDITVYAQTALAGAAAAARFDGVYTYDIVTYGGNTFHRLCAEAHAMHLLCAPSVGPGLQRAARQRRPGRQAAQARADLRRDVARRDLERSGQRHHHVVQRVARGNADRAGRRPAARELPLPLVRRRLGPPRRSGGERVPRRGRATGRTSSAARSPAQPKTKAS